METPASTLRRTPLYPTHVELGARMVPFAGYEMPIQYAGILDEHHAVRYAAGLFDVSHMGEFWVTGPQAFDLIQHVVTNDAATLYDGRAMYCVMCREDGTTIDDLLVYRLAEDEYMLVVNASNTEKDIGHIRRQQERLGLDCEIKDRSEDVALLALQGPAAIGIAAALTDVPIEGLQYYHFLQPEPGAFLGCERAILSRTGYTGEAGLEIYCEREKAERVWNAIMDAGREQGILPCGLGARDTLRLEAGFCLYGSELTDETTPLEAGLGWVVKLQKEGDFLGREALIRQKEEGLERKLVGFVLEERGIPRPGYPLLSSDGSTIGHVTSGSQSPVLERGIGLGYVENDPAYTAPDSSLRVEVRGRGLRATVRKPPFHK
jgi:aminomethyltransferase